MPAPEPVKKESTYERLMRLQSLLDITNNQLGLARSKLADARKAETNAINECNRLQKQFEEVISEWRDAAPPGTDWNADRYEKD